MSKITKKVWGEGTPWATKSQWLSFIRGGIRRCLWARNPVKLNFLKKHTKKIKNTNEASKKRFPKVNGAKCNICKKWHRVVDVEVDHIDGHHSLRKLEDLMGYFESIVMITEDDLQVLCKECHKTKSLADSRGISLEEAKFEQKVIQFRKLKANKQRDFLTKVGVDPEGNASKREKQYREYLRGVKVEK